MTDIESGSMPTEIEWQRLPAFLSRALRSGGIFTIDRLAASSMADLFSIRGMGRKGRMLLECYLEEKGIPAGFADSLN
jgi:DNA-directed RNA polymerase alpha subunit